MNAVSNGATGGTTGQSLRAEAVKIAISGMSGGITYRTHVQNIGWTSWRSNNQVSGTTGQSLRMESIQVKLTGTIAQSYDVYYRAHCEVYGWLGWAKNGESAGTVGGSKRLEALQIKLVPKSQSISRGGTAFYDLSNGSDNTNTDTNTNTSSLSASADQLVTYALSQVGVGDSKGNNNVVYNTWYYGRSINGSGYAWCAAFVSYCANQAGLLNTYIPKHSSCNNGVTWFRNKSQFYKSQYYGGSYTPKKGDIVYYTSNGSSSCHVGIITGSPVNGYLQVVEGNVYCSGGDYKVVSFTKNAKRRVDSSYVLGYGVWY
jgi:hypothetical protein